MQSQLTEAYGLSQCPDNPAAIISECGDSVPCQYDYTTLNAKVSLKKTIFSVFEAPSFFANFKTLKVSSRFSA